MEMHKPSHLLKSKHLLLPLAAVMVLGVVTMACGIDTQTPTPVIRPTETHAAAALATVTTEQQNSILSEIKGDYSPFIRENNLTAHEFTLSTTETDQAKIEKIKLEKIVVVEKYIRSAAAAMKKNPQFDDANLDDYHVSPRVSLSNYLNQIADAVDDAIKSNRVKTPQLQYGLFWKDTQGKLNIDLRAFPIARKNEVDCCREKNGKTYVPSSEVEFAMDIINSYYQNITFGAATEPYGMENDHIDSTMWWIAFRFLDKLNQMNDNSAHFPGTAWYDAVDKQERTARQNRYQPGNHVAAFYKLYLDTAKTDAQSQGWKDRWDINLYQEMPKPGDIKVRIATLSQTPEDLSTKHMTQEITVVYQTEKAGPKIYKINLIRDDVDFTPGFYYYSQDKDKAALVLQKGCHVSTMFYLWVMKKTPEGLIFADGQKPTLVTIDKYRGHPRLLEGFFGTNSIEKSNFVFSPDGQKFQMCRNANECETLIDLKPFYDKLSALN